VATRTLKIELSRGTALVALASIAAAWLFLQLWPIFLVVIVALMLVGMLNPTVAKLEARGVRRGGAIAIVFGGLFVLGGAFCALTLPSLIDQLTSVVENLPATQQKVATYAESSRVFAPLAKTLREPASKETIDTAGKYVLGTAAAAAGALAYAVTAVFLSLYLMIDRDRMRGALFALVPRAYHVRLSRVILNLETIVGGYMRGQVLTSFLCGGFALIVLLVAGVPNALALALFAAVADVLPYIGAALACAPAFAATLNAKGTTIAFIVLGVLLVYQEFESRFIVPRIYGKVLRLPSATVMIALLIGGKLLGILGALLALPIAAAVRMLIEELRIALPGEELDDKECLARDERAEREFERRAAGEPAETAAAIATEVAEQRLEEESPDRAEAARSPLTTAKVT
jgi:predicted PurR-regulated permease PerM